MNDRDQNDEGAARPRPAPWTPGDWRWNVERLRAMGRHELADRLEAHVPIGDHDTTRRNP